MGLDMYLYALDDEDLDSFNKIKTILKETPDTEYSKEEDELLEKFYDKKGDELAYWRKANAIHKFFCDYGEVVDEHIYYIIPRKLLVELLKKCMQVLIIKHETYSEETLPTCGGFFFGSLEYNEFYYNYLEETVNTLAKLLKEYKNDYFLYCASW